MPSKEERTDSDAEREQAFIQHLEEASKVVESWPEWKQSVLGWRPNNASISVAPKPANGKCMDPDPREKDS